MGPLVALPLDASGICTWASGLPANQDPSPSAESSPCWRHRSLWFPVTPSIPSGFCLQMFVRASQFLFLHHQHPPSVRKGRNARRLSQSRCSSPLNGFSATRVLQSIAHSPSRIALSTLSQGHPSLTPVARAVESERVPNINRRHNRIGHHFQYHTTELKSPTFANTNAQRCDEQRGTAHCGPPCWAWAESLVLV